MTTDWHAQSVQDVTRLLDVTEENGLTQEQVTQRLSHYGRNVIARGRRRSVWSMWLAQLSDFMIVVLMIAAITSGLVGDISDTLVILAIIVLNAIIGFTQEYRAEQAMQALQQLSAPTAHVMREGVLHIIEASTLVPGDIVTLEAGARVPADIRLMEVAGLRVDEATLTGESHPADKLTEPTLTPQTPLADRHNMVYEGTMVVHGRGVGVVIGTGPQTELGRIATLLNQQPPTQTPLQKRLAAFGRNLAWAVLAICATLFLTGVLRGESVTVMFLTAISLAVAAIPEALPAVVTVSLALGAHRMVRQHALVRRLPAVETLGSVTYICSDKTGTLTQNRMHVQTLLPYEDAGTDASLMCHQLMALNNDAVSHRQGHAQGDPTEVALLMASQKAGINKRELERRYPRIAEMPFDAIRKRMSTVHAITDELQPFVVLVKGAPETVLPLCGLATARMTEVAERMASAGLRVMALAQRKLTTLPDELTPKTLETDLTLLGLVGLSDPPRREAKHAVAECQRAGITPVMITGDHPFTAAAIARELHMLNGGEVMTGEQLQQLSDAEFAQRVQDIRVYARMDPAQKIRIVQALQDRGEFVAMTGDGVNDAPALKRADIGVAMGKVGTDVAREAASLVLLNDNFATVVEAIKQGRRIYDNIRKFVRYTLTSNSGEIWTLFLAPFLGLPIPLLPIHILWVNLVTDGLPGLALAMEPAERDIMQRPPRPPQESIFAHGMWQHILWVGLLMGCVTLLTLAWALHTGSPHWQSMAFTVLTLSQLGHALAVRSERRSLYTQKLTSNLPLLGAVLLSLALQMAVLYVPTFNAVFKTAPLSMPELLLCLAMSSVVFLAVEAEKWAIRRGYFYKSPST